MRYTITLLALFAVDITQACIIHNYHKMVYSSIDTIKSCTQTLKECNCSPTKENNYGR